MSSIKEKYFFDSIFSMGTRFNVLFTNVNLKTANIAFKAIKKEVERLHNKLSYFYEKSDVYYINQQAGKQEVMVDDELFDILGLCQKYNSLTKGCFDITFTPLIEAYNAQLSKQKTNEIKKSVGTQKIQLNNKNHSISLLHKDTKIDLGGFAKGYALEKVKMILKKYDVQNALVSFGDSTILAMGKHPNGDCWKVGINNVFKPQTSLYDFSLQNETLSTSSNVKVGKNNNVIINDHIIDPATMQITKKLSIASVCSSSSLDAEVLSTALFVDNKGYKGEKTKEFNNICCVKLVLNKSSKVFDLVSFMNNRK